jgi:serine protease
MGLAVSVSVLAASGATLVAPSAQAGASTARVVSATGAGLGLTDPTGDHHGFRHGAVPRIVSSSGPVSGPVSGQATPLVAPALAPARVAEPPAPRSGSKLLEYGGGLTANGLVGAGVTSGQPRVYLVFLGSQWGTEGTGTAGRVTFGDDPDGEAGALQTLYSGFGTDGELWSGTVTQYCDGVAIGATSCGSASQSIPYPTGDVLAGVWYDSSAIATSLAATGITGHQLALETEAAATHFGNTSQAANRDAQYVMASPTGSDADGWSNPQTGYCAYHDDTHDPSIDGGGPVSGPILAFTNLPYVPDAGAACGAGSVNDPGVLDGATEAASHEYAETLTDQFPEATPPGGWSDAGGSEIADKCAYIAAPAAGAAYDLTLATGTVAVQGLWSNQANGGSGGCVQSAPVDHFLPTVTSISPVSAAVGSAVTIIGTNLSGATRVAFGGVTATVVSDGPGTVVALVPSGVSSGTVSVTTPTGTGTSGQIFAVAAPTIKKFTAAAVGQGVTITGSNLSGATRVAFNGTTAVVVSDGISTVVAVVPTGATSGPVTVQTPGGTATSVKSFAPVPTLTSIAPSSGAIGSSVTLTGTGLAGAKRVAFDGHRATVVSDSATAIVVVVPKHATTGPVSVATPGGSTTGLSMFSVT